MNAYYVIGGLFALWALTLTAVGVTRENFPRGRNQAFAVGAISVLLAAGTIGSGIVTGLLEEDEAEGTEAPAAEGPAQQPAQEPGASTLRLSADPGGQLSFDKKSLDAPSGAVRLVLSNPSSVPHNVSITGHGVNEEGDTVGKDGRSTVAAELEPGRYVFFCSVPGHRQAGMEGTLTVR